MSSQHRVIEALFPGNRFVLYFNKLWRNTNMTINKSKLSIALGTVFVASMAASSVASAAQSPFAMASLDKGYMVAAADTAKDSKMKDGKCGEGKCGGDKKAKDAKADDKSKMKDGKCGEGKCGGKK
jgi:uncharacterized low-complexity protein